MAELRGLRSLSDNPDLNSVDCTHVEEGCFIRILDAPWTKETCHKLELFFVSFFVAHAEQGIRLAGEVPELIIFRERRSEAGDLIENTRIGKMQLLLVKTSSC